VTGAFLDPCPTKGVIDQRQLHLAEIIVERAAFYEERVTTIKAGVPQEHGHIASRLSNEYLNLRIALVSISRA